MAYDRTAPATDSAQASAQIRENFFEGPPIIAHDLEVEGDVRTNDHIYIRNDGADGDGYLYFYENSSEVGASLMWDDSEGRFELSHALQATDLRASGSVYVNTGSAGVSTIFFNDTAQDLSWDATDSEFRFSENLQILGNKMTIGERDSGGGITARYLKFANPASNDDAGGIRYNYSDRRMEYSNDNIDWFEITSPTGTSGIDTVLGIGNTAYDKTMYVGDIYSMSTFGDDFISLNGEGATIGPEIAFFSLADSETARFSFDGSTPEMILDTQLSLIDTSDDYKDLYAKDLTLMDNSGQTASTNYIHFGVGILNNYIEVASSFVLNTMTLRSLEVIAEVTGSFTSEGNVKAYSNLYINSDYSAGDEDASIFFNDTEEHLTYDYGLLAFVASPPTMYIGDGAAENCTLYLYDDSGTTVRVWVNNADGKMNFEDSTGTYSLDALGGGSPVSTIDQVTAAGAVTANTCEFGDLRIAGNGYVNYGGPDGDSYLYFYQAASNTGAYMMFDDAPAAQFVFSNTITATGDIQATVAIEANSDGDSATDDAIYRFCNTNPKTLKWNYTNARFEFDDKLYCSGTFYPLDSTNAMIVRQNCYVFVASGGGVFDTTGVYFNIAGLQIEYRYNGNRGLGISLDPTAYGTIGIRKYKQNGTPTTGQCPADYSCIWEDTDDANRTYLCHNTSGSILKVEMT